MINIRSTKRSQASRFLLQAAALILVISLLSCGAELPAETTEPVTTAGVVSSEPEQTTEPPVAVPATVSKDLFGFDPWHVEPDTAGIVETYFDESRNLVLLALKAGKTTVTVKNVFAEEATVTVEAAADLTLEYTVEKFVQPRSLNVREEGAKLGNDITAVLQSCIDRLSTEGGGTVYIPAGSYKLSSVTLRPGVTLRFSGFPRRATDGYKGDLLRDISKGYFAMVTTTGSSRNNIFFYNTELPQSYCTSGYSDLHVSGGLFDCQSKMKWSATACGDNIVFENAVVKDLPNNHAMQIDGCSNFTVRNIVFAGYVFPDGAAITRETIQIEQTTPGAITSDHANSPILCDNGDYHNCRNVSVLGCYFGKSDKTGPQLVAVGHHSAGGSLICDGFVFEGNKVENPLYCGLHIPNYINVVIRNNEFISDTVSPAAAVETGAALISLYGFDSNNSFSIGGKTVMHAFSYEHPGNQNYVIEGNSFTLGGRTSLKAVSIIGVSISNKNDAYYTVSSTTYRVEQYPGPLFSLDGYVMRQNIAANITFANNTINVKSRPNYTNHVVALKNILGYFDYGNTVTYADGVDMSQSAFGMKGYYVYPNSVITDREKMNDHKVRMSSSATKKFVISAPGTTILVANPTVDLDYNFVCSGNGTVTLHTNKKGDLQMEIAPDSGWKFDGFYDKNGNKADLRQPVSENTMVTVKFVKTN